MFHIPMLYDREASKIALKMTFVSDEFELQPYHIMMFKKEWRLRLVNEDNLPENMLCQVIAQPEKFDVMKYIFFNPDFIIPEECHEEPLLNKNLLDRSAKNGWLWIEVLIPLKNKDFALSICFEKIR